MVIEFSTKYHVRHDFGNIFTVTVPRDDLPALKSLLEKQQWILVVDPNPWPSLLVQNSPAYSITTTEAVDALSRLCEFVMSNSSKTKLATNRLKPRQEAPLVSDVIWYRGNGDLPVTSAFVLNEFGNKVSYRAGQWITAGVDGGYYEIDAPSWWCYISKAPLTTKG